ncbi:MAG: iron-containing alcohol dehydrogenase [Candidatus Aenigmatarchaeota archaeon]
MINLPQKILIEENAVTQLSDFLQEFGSSCFAVIDPFIRKNLIPGTEFNQVIEPQSMEKEFLKNISNAVTEDFVIGIGGGKAIDTAKYVAYVSKRKWIAFPTILSHDGIVSSRAVLADNGTKISVDAKEPSAIIADLSIIKQSPYKFVAAGCGDLLAKVSAVEDWKLAAKRQKEPYHSLIAELSLITANSVIEHVDEIKAMSTHGLEIMMWSLISSGFAMNIHGSSRPASGSEHNFSHALDALQSSSQTGIYQLHGFQAAMGTLVSLYLHGKDWSSLRSIMQELGIPTTAREIDLPRELLIKALVNARSVRERYTILDEVYIDETKAREILEAVGII